MHDLAPFIDELTAHSGPIIRQYFGRTDLEIERKSDASPVTRADREAEAALRKLIETNFPEHGFLGEESGGQREDAEYVWVVDPIDGTISFAHGCPLFGTLIGLLHHGKPVLGAIHLPALNTLIVGDGEEARLNGSPVAVRTPDSLTEATLLTTDTVAVPRYQNGAGFEQLCQRVRVVRTWGDCYGYVLVASGQADIMLDTIMNPWDLLPLVPIIRGAGGSITAWDGGDPVTANSSVACHPKLHGELMAILGAQS